eukprot:488757_1
MASSVKRIQQLEAIFTTKDVEPKVPNNSVQLVNDPISKPEVMKKIPKLVQSVDFQLIKSIDQRTKQIVFGYMRRHEHLLISDITPHISNTIPPLVVYCCLIYYWLNEYFDTNLFVTNPIGITRTRNNPTIAPDNKMTIQHLSYGMATCWGYQTISSMENCKYRWNLKINNHNYTRSLLIGITENDVLHGSIFYHKFHRNTYKQRQYIHYIYNSYTGFKKSHKPWTISNRKWYWQPYGTKFGAGDIIGIELDLQKRTLSFFVNGISQGIAFDNIETVDDIQYKLVVNMQTDDNITLIELR